MIQPPFPPVEARTIEPGRAGPGRTVEGVFHHAAGDRRYLLYLPAGYTRSEPRAMIVLLHGCTQDAADAARGTRLDQLADRFGFLVLYPEQPAGANPLKCWNWFDPAHQHRGAGEPALLADLALQIAREYAQPDSGTDGTPVIYWCGVSAGAAMAQLIAAAYPERVAGLALHSGVAAYTAESAGQAMTVMKAPPGEHDLDGLAGRVLAEMGERRRPIRVIIFQGADDQVVAPGNAAAVAGEWLRVDAAALGLPLESIVADTQREPASITTFRAPDGRTLVEEWLVPGVGHAWSGGAAEGSYTAPAGPDASRELVRFFFESEHPAEHIPRG